MCKNWYFSVSEQHFTVFSLSPQGDGERPSPANSSRSHHFSSPPLLSPSLVPTMSTPQRSRYPRPLKATHTFPGGSGGPGQSQGGQLHSLNNGSTSPSACSGSPAAAAASGSSQLKTGQSSPPPPGAATVRRCLSSPERRSPISGRSKLC